MKERWLRVLVCGNVTLKIISDRACLRNDDMSFLSDTCLGTQTNELNVLDMHSRDYSLITFIMFVYKLIT